MGGVAHRPPLVLFRFSLNQNSAVVWNVTFLSSRKVACNSSNNTFMTDIISLIAVVLAVAVVVIVNLNHGPEALRDGADQNGVACGSNQQLLSVHVCDGANCPEVFWNLLLLRSTFKPEASCEDPDLHRAAGVCVHLALLLGRQVHTPADDLAVFATSTEKSATMQ